ncbi:MAG: AI-2E family transporter [Bacteriovorax sp.]|nr:AI-2E family transporter [Bacteriovorax sp.]
MMNHFHEVFFRNFFKLFTAFVIVAGFLYILSPFMIPVLFGGMLAMALSPFLSYFMKKYHWARQKALLVLTLLLFLIGAVPSGIFLLRGSKIINEFFSKQSITGFTQNIQGKIYAIVDNMAEHNNIDPVVVREKFDNFSNQAGAWILKVFSDFVTQIPDLALAALVIVLAFYFFLSKEHHIRSLFNHYFYFSQSNAEKFVSVMKSSCREVFFSNVLTGVLQSLIVSLGALACGLGDLYIIFFFTFIISFIPIIGAAPMAFVLALYAFFDSKIGPGITMAVIGFISGVADNIVRPYLVSLGEVEVPALIGFLAVIGGVIVLGLPGLFVGPLLASMMYGILPIIVEEYFPHDNANTHSTGEDLG